MPARVSKSGPKPRASPDPRHSGLAEREPEPRGGHAARDDPLGSGRALRAPRNDGVVPISIPPIPGAPRSGEPGTYKHKRFEILGSGLARATPHTGMGVADAAWAIMTHLDPLQGPSWPSSIASAYQPMSCA
jgi:hypothetical protein